jgi:enoyl-CoA hydratase/carnithine racemase
LVRDLLALAPLALQDTKQSIREIEAGLGDVSRMRERAQRASQSADFAEGRAAFAQRRTPVFTGR